MTHFLAHWEMRAARQSDAAASGVLTQPPTLAIFGVTDPALTGWIKERETPHSWTTYAEPLPSYIRSLTFSPDGKLLFGLTDHGSIIIWDISGFYSR